VQSRGNGVRLCATDGHRLAIFHDEAGFTSADCILPLPKVVRQLIKSAKRRDQMWFAIIGEHGKRNECRLFSDGEAELGELAEVREAIENPTSRGIVWSGPIELIDGTFPEIDRIVPAKRANVGSVAAFDSKLMKDFGAVAGDLQRKPDGPVYIYPAGWDPALVDCGRPDFVGVVMPRRANARGLIDAGQHVIPPAWVRNVEPQTAA
jgi:hypothetical protein